MSSVIIDIGHYGAESGAVYGGYKECDLNYSIGMKVVNKLKERYAVQVSTTTGSLADRVRYENANSPSVFVSIHCNAGGGTGFESWIYEVNTKCEQLAKCINSEYEISMNMKNRGIKVSKDFYVLKNTKAPAVLFECGFMDSNDLTKLVSEQEKISNGIVNGIAKYLGLKSNTSSNVYEITVQSGIKELKIKFQ